MALFNTGLNYVLYTAQSFIYINLKKKTLKVYKNYKLYKFKTKKLKKCSYKDGTLCSKNI